MSTQQDNTPSRKKGIVAYAQNPFWQTTEVQVGSKLIRVAGGQHINDDGESVSHSGIHVIKEVDETEFLKIYTKNVRAIFDLKPTSQRVLQYLMTELQKTPNADGIYLAWVGANEYFQENQLDVSRASFQRALKELLDKGFIAESIKPNMFWFNPNLFFNGNRMTFVSEYRRKPISNSKSEEEQLNWVEQA